MSQTHQANTFRWDIVYAIQATEVNRAIAAGGKYPKSLDYNPPGGDGWVKASIDSWQIVPGGDTAHIKFALGLKNITFGGLGAAGAGRALPSVTVFVMTALQFQRRTANSGTHELRVAPPPDDGSGQTALVCSIDPASLVPGSLSMLARNTLAEVINDWVTASVDAFDHVFAEMDIFQTAAQGDFAWLKATTIDYSYACDANDQNLDHAVLGVLAMTNGHVDNLSEVLVSPFVIPAGSTAGCLISQDLYLGGGLLPRMAELFAGTQASDFQYLSDQNVNIIKLKNEVQLAPQKSDDDTDCPCALAALELEIIADRIKLFTRTRVLVRGQETIVITPGGNKVKAQVIHATRNLCYAYTEETAYFTLAVGAINQGQQPVTFSPVAGQGSTRAWTEPPLDDADKTSQNIHDYTQYALIGLSFISIFANPLLAVGYGLALAGMTATGAVGHYLDRQTKTSAPMVNHAVLQQAMTFQWCGGKGYQLTSAGLNNGLQFGATLGH